jgi:hypothetical protein
VTALATLATDSVAGRTGQLTDIVLGSNPYPGSRFAQRTGRQADIAEVDFYRHGDWSIACNQHRVGAGTVGWIARQGDGRNPPLGGFVVCTGSARSQEEIDLDGHPIVEWYVPGHLHGGLWIRGEDIAGRGWPDRRSPWGRNARRQFRNGEAIKPPELLALIDAVPVSTLRTVALEHRQVTGRFPWWWARRSKGL